MTLKDLGIPSIEDLERMTDDEVRQHFSKFLEICKPKVILEQTKTKKKKPVSLTLNKTDEVNHINTAKLQEMASKLGFGNLKLDDFIKK